MVIIEIDYIWREGKKGRLEIEDGFGMDKMEIIWNDIWYSEINKRH